MPPVTPVSNFDIEVEAGYTCGKDKKHTTGLLRLLTPKSNLPGNLHITQKSYPLISMEKDTMSTNVSLTPELEAYAQSLVASGSYKSVSEFIREAIRLHRNYEKLYLRELRNELSLAAGQIDNGQTELHSMDSIMDEVRSER